MLPRKLGGIFFAQKVYSSAAFSKIIIRGGRLFFNHSELGYFCTT
jgi:hypothetical protein